MSVTQAQPLPECVMCEAPTKRATHERNGGLCTDCARSVVLGQARQARLATRLRRSV